MDYGNCARLAMATNTVRDPDHFDIRCATECDTTPVNNDSCEGTEFYPLGNLTRRIVATKNNGIVANEATPKTVFAAHRYVLNLPGQTSGSYSRNLNHLFFLGSVVFLYDTPTTEWYYPALTNGVTHVAVNSTSVSDVLGLVNNDTSLQHLIAKAGVDVAHRFLCATCLAHFFTNVATALRHRFGFRLLDDPTTAHRLLQRHLNCTVPLLELSLTNKHHLMVQDTHCDPRRILLTEVD